MTGMKQRLIAAGTVLSLLPALAASGPCDATFKFDGDLADASGNVQDGVMRDTRAEGSALMNDKLPGTFRKVFDSGLYATH